MDSAILRQILDGFDLFQGANHDASQVMLQHYHAGQVIHDHRRPRVWKSTFTILRVDKIPVWF